MNTKTINNKKRVYVNSDLCEIKNLHFKQSNNKIINFTYKLKNILLDGFNFKSPLIRLIENITLDNNENRTHKLIIPLLDCNSFYNLFINMDDKIKNHINNINNNYNKNYIYNTFVKETNIILDNDKYNYNNIVLEFQLKNTTIIINNNKVSENLNNLDINNFEVTFYITINGLICEDNNIKAHYTINELCLNSNPNYNNIEYYKKNYLFKKIVNKYEKSHSIININSDILDDNIDNDNDDNDDYNDDEIDSDNEIISFPNFEFGNFINEFSFVI